MIDTHFAHFLLFDEGYILMNICLNVMLIIFNCITRSCGYNEREIPEFLLALIWVNTQRKLGWYRKISEENHTQQEGDISNVPRRRRVCKQERDNAVVSMNKTRFHFFIFIDSLSLPHHERTSVSGLLILIHFVL